MSVTQVTLSVLYLPGNVGIFSVKGHAFISQEYSFWRPFFSMGDVPIFKILPVYQINQIAHICCTNIDG